MTAHHVEVDAPGRLDAAVAAAVDGLTRSRAAALVRDGHVTVDGEVLTRVATKVRVGQRLTVTVPEAAPSTLVPQDLPLAIVHEDEHVLVVDKAAGRVVHPGAGHRDGTLVNALLYHARHLSGVGGVERPGLVHRLDRGTSGLMVVACHDRAHQHLAAQFADHSAGRRYLALCCGPSGAGPGGELGGTLRTRLARHPRERVRFASVQRPEGGKPAVTHWQVRGRRGDVAVVEAWLETGRTHQVRVHLTELGLPLLGDPLYKRRGGTVPAALRPLVRALDDRPLLHAWSLSFTHPGSGERCTFTAPVPADFAEAVAAVGLDEAVPDAARPHR